MPTEDFAPLPLQLRDRTQWRYEVIRPVVLFADRTPQQRARETQTHPATVRRLTRQFRQQGMLGLLPADVEVGARGQTTQIPDPVRHELDHLKALYDGFHYRELARILLVKLGYAIDDKTVKKLWQASPVRCQGHLGLWDYHAQPDRYQARLQVIKLYYQGWEKISIHRFSHVSRPTIDAWIRRFETAHFAGLADRSRAPYAPVRKIWLPLMVQVYHLQKVHPDAGAFRIWSLLARADVSVRTVGRVMALNRLVYDDIPHVPKRGVKPAPGPHPYKAQARHQYWFIDGRRMDFALDGVHWWSLIILEGYSRTMLAGMIAPTEATWVALMVLYTACLRYGAPASLVSDAHVKDAVTRFAEEPPVLVDWLPWHHVLGGNVNFGLTLFNGGTLYIDDGQPVPGRIDETVRNLREVAPLFYFSVPKGYEALVPWLRRDRALRESFFSRVASHHSFRDRCRTRLTQRGSRCATIQPRAAKAAARGSRWYSSSISST
jgi:hypothetical protein